MSRRQRPCTDCGRLLNVGKGSLPEPTCRECRRKRPHHQVVTSVCPTCGKEFSKPIQQTYCSIECSNKRHCPERVGDPNAAATRKMRRTVRCRERRLRRAQTWDGITDDEIWERDGWRCQVPECQYRSRKINRRYKYPDPRSPGVDHIVPLSLGGDDTCVNKRAAHHGCNMARGNRMGHEQLLLIGSLREPPLQVSVVDGQPRRVRAAKRRPCISCGVVLPPDRRKYCETCIDARKPPPKMTRCPCGNEFPARLAAKRGDVIRCPDCVADLVRRSFALHEQGYTWKEVAAAVGRASPGTLYALVQKRRGDEYVA